MIGVIENISHSTAKMCRGAITHVQYSLTYNSQMKCFQTHDVMDFILVLACGNSAENLAQKLVTLCRESELHVVFFFGKFKEVLHLFHVFFSLYNFGLSFINPN
jgi:hypothetical protein